MSKRNEFPFIIFLAICLVVLAVSIPMAIIEHRTSSDVTSFEVYSDQILETCSIEDDQLWEELMLEFREANYLWYVTFSNIYLWSYVHLMLYECAYCECRRDLAVRVMVNLMATNRLYEERLNHIIQEIIDYYCKRD